MDVTVVVCTYNRSSSLATSLRSLAAMTISSSITWEVLIVDNNSSDQTSVVAQDFCAKYPEIFRYMFESQQGLAYARNAGIREARGEIIAYTDDDVQVDPNWLQNLTAELERGAWTGVGGRVLPMWNCIPPRWLPTEGRFALAPLTVFDLGATAGELADAPVGANMAMRREVFQKYGGFRTDLGRRPGTLIGNEDTEFGHRLLNAGERLWYEPSATIYHPVQHNRISKEYFLKWSFDQGRADILAFGIPCNTRWRLQGVPLFLFRRLIVWTIRWILSFEPSRRFSSKRSVWALAGKIIQCHCNAAVPSPHLSTNTASVVD